MPRASGAMNVPDFLDEGPLEGLPGKVKKELKSQG